MEQSLSEIRNEYELLLEVGDNVTSGGMTWETAASVLNLALGNSFTESAYRKKYKSFKAGMIYARGVDDKTALRILSISDLHVPFQKPVDTFKEYSGRVDILQLNGDITDCGAISKFPKAYRKSPMEEITETRQYLIDLIEAVRPKKVMVNYGNHDIRFQNYLAKNLDTDLLELMPKTS